MHPMAAIWDDHEFADNAWTDGAPDHDPDKHGSWRNRREAAARAWREWMPVRLPDPAEPMRTWRTMSYGDLVDLVLVDTRMVGRDRQVTSDKLDELDSWERTLLGKEQESWLADELTRPGATWLLLVNQVVLTPLKANLPGGLPDGAAENAGLIVDDGNAFNPDQWDGYPAAQQRLLEQLAARPGGGAIVLTGDIHSSMALENPGRGDLPAVTEIVTPAVTTTTLGQRLGSLADQIFDSLIGDEDHVRWASLYEHGFVVIDATAERLSAEWWHVDQIDRRGGTWSFAAGFERGPRQARLIRTDRPSVRSDSLAQRATQSDGDDAWFDPFLSLPGGLGTAAVAAAGAGFVLRRRSATARRDGDRERGGGNETNG